MICAVLCANDWFSCNRSEHKFIIKCDGQWETEKEKMRERERERERIAFKKVQHEIEVSF